MRFPGIIPAVTTPFDATGAVDVAALEANLGALLDAGVHGFVATGTMGEAGSMSAEERRLVVETAVRAAAGRVPVCVAAEDAPAAAQAQAVLRLLGGIVAERTDAEWRVVDLLVPGARGQQKLVAAELGISPQAVSKAVARTRWQEEWDARPAAARLLDLCEPAPDGPAHGGAQGSTMNPSESIHS